MFNTFVLYLKSNPMRIVKIEIDEVSKHLIYGDLVLYSVVLTTKNWIGITNRIPAFPTGYAHIFRTKNANDNDIQYYDYCDSLGKNFDADVCIQIMNFLNTRKLNGRNI